ncbi:YciI family protein [Ramlibacter sp.]|uniref:YciI family protein n=1 Tax=Ramlibacter sp. TaxID=1917967 RepID=UPI0017F0D7C7|nr:YciI family protein [Ramlibacter sp.]MBA2674170.1 YciI family protein [Ramlibacter sp.]
MELFAIYALDKPGGAEARRKARAPHLRFITEHPEAFVYGGPLLGPDGATCGSLMILRAENRAALDRHMAQDPYFNSGMFASVAVWPTRQVIPEASSGALKAELEKQLAVDAAAKA